MADEQHQKLNELFKLGAELVGNSSGNVLGFVFGGALGAVIGGAATPLITEFSKRLLSSRQQARVGATLIYAREDIQKKLDAGLKPNSEFFEDKNKDGRPDVNEIWEGILLNAEQEYEERKIPYYANLMANIAFESSYSKERAGFLIKLSKNLSYRQLCLLAIFAGTEIKASLRQSDYRGQGSLVSQHQASILHEILEMHSIGIVSLPNDALLGVTDVNPSKMHVQGAGVELGRLMELNAIPMKGLRDLAVDLS